ncbi:MULTISPECIES: PepSY-associated TM helix domain-containing protein [unclassified Sphingomonas]|uniref:PepSY-associated TM helix domain-containing protein n=1 Tax=unclassified Sphingomonas TaxID=196159 RepID=UPI0006F4D0E7|nr:MULTISPECIES: PepSY domain-containing protein [unclassified Sphingomonas]KQM27628.1 peptidase M4 [Sphingomonas sp. Leaf9]KQM43968.1 peptidase M4 [Sphingomonas sp. Leaf11]
MSNARLYRTIWRWHFYAGLIVAPFLLILSITGAIYLFKDELNDALMPDLQVVAPVARALPPSRMIAAAVRAVPGVPTRIDLPDAPDRPAKVWIDAASGEPRQVMVDPASARVLGSYVYTHTLVGFADVMHGSLTFGPWGDAVVELAACWALMLIASGLFLWWPRGRRSLAGVLWPRLRTRGRVFWRDLHAVTGVWSVALIAFLLLTGLPWAVVEGPLVRGAFTALGIGNEAARFGHEAPHSAPMATLGDVPWSQAMAPMPASDPAHADHGGGAHHSAMADPAAITGTDAIAARARAAGIIGGYRLYLPAGPTGIYTVMVTPRQPEGQRTLQFDRWSGRLLWTNGWDRYGVGAKAVELGVQIHMGRYFGLPNQLLMLLPCIAIVLLVVSGVTMWWRRRPKGRLAAPPPVSGARLRGAITLLVVSGVVLPLFGASLLVLGILDRIVVALRRRVAV